MESTTHLGSSIALIAGASGLIGSSLVQILLESDRYKTVVSVGRKPLDLQHPKLQNEVIDFDALPQVASSTQPTDVFCCLGTTIKKAGSQEAFKKVDYTYVLNLARYAEKIGARRFLVVSSVGANPEASVFYSRVKGEMERDVSQLSIPEIHIFRPSILLGKREEFRLGERIAGGLATLIKPLFIGSMAKYKPAKAEVVAKAMHSATAQKNSGIHYYEGNQIPELANMR